MALNFTNYKSIIDNADRITSHFHQTIEHLFSDVGANNQKVKNGSLGYVTLESHYEYRALRVYAQWAETQVANLKHRLEALYELRLMDPH